MIKRQWRAWSLAGLLMLVVGATGQRGVGQAVPAASPTFEVSTVKVKTFTLISRVRLFVAERCQVDARDDRLKMRIAPKRIEDAVSVEVDK